LSCLFYFNSVSLSCSGMHSWSESGDYRIGEGNTVYDLRKLLLVFVLDYDLT
jgi:hypothetical protein